ncbi:uncharacterized protein LOC123721774 [Papilio machaon]|uniref:uncharacterized protein LOC123721774 n=1 Tax=Papilio machaon TaxID=76193 RepID=UPI001E6642F5|nr:uncharacterized protein LOC123721774 [Papilio machaon]XP_045537423.1 uncharacterized protein LOC123721774 [Papilio machaon]XP_045537424.1 uncharacterized protein LOC123721774 [Papilio machaon]
MSRAQVKSSLVTQNLMLRANTLQATFNFRSINASYDIVTSPDITINGAANFQVKIIMTQEYEIQIYHNLIFVKLYKVRTDDDLTYTMTLSSKHLEIENKTFPCDDGTWHLIKELQNPNFAFDISVVMNIVQCATFAALYDEVDLMDFELRGEDGAVRMHRAVLAAYSPVLRRMLNGSWRETAEGHVDVPGTSRKTLQHLKEYMYLHTLPDTDLEPILVLASYYMMHELEQMCANRLVGALVAENVCELLHFAAKHRLTRLLLAVLDSVQNGAIKVKDVREHYMRSKILCGDEEAGINSPSEIAS